jgi:CDP-diacylglycerol---glycerol-3-phosphate 3-phosphatidyltransferase
MGLYTLKFGYRKVLEPLGKYNINPDHLAYLAVLVSLATAFSYYFAAGYPILLILAIALIFTRMTLNTLDGVIAIRRKLVSPQGDIMNAFPDRYSDIILFSGIALSGLAHRELGLIATTLILLVSYCGMMGKAVGASWQHNGPLGKVDRLIALMLLTFLQYLSMFIGHPTFAILGISLSMLDIFMIWAVIGSQITIFNRLKGMLAELPAHKKK